MDGMQKAVKRYTAAQKKRKAAHKAFSTAKKSKRAKPKKGGLGNY